MDEHRLAKMEFMWFFLMLLIALIIMGVQK